MTVRRKYVNEHDEVVVGCSACGRHRILVEVSRTFGLGVLTSVPCSCGAKMAFVFERRRFLRKYLHAPGICWGPSGSSWSVSVENLSVGGIQFFVESIHDLEVGDLVMVEYRMGGVTPVTAAAEVRRVDGARIGAKVNSHDAAVVAPGAKGQAKE